ncbi:MAG: sigma-70 family RNA polymerase sigma factor [Planctomycetes bacterium]|jgi:RNA polymerase sigma factor (TIGR02999 family)|nr:sigma-70 family RNA polymerase sigma factor [Planctomycetota bacterium]
MSDVTRILNALERGDAQATDKLLPLVYEELRLLAAQRLAHEKPGQTLQATALVHEAYLRLIGDEPQTWNSRGHFFAAAAEAMRRILVENARHKRCRKHGSGLRKVDLDHAEVMAEELPENVIALDEALARLSQEDPLAAELVKMRYFAGLTLPQTAEALGISPRTADRCWAYAKAWLYHEIAKGEPGPAGQAGTAV